MTSLESADGWGGRDDRASEFAKMLGAAQEGGSTVAECRLAASRISGDDDDSWFREWKSLADRNKARGEAALREGHLITARRNWLRAANYYLTAAYPLDDSDQRYLAAITGMRHCVLQAMRLRRPIGEVISLPLSPNHLLEGFFLPASDSGAAAPVVLCLGEPHERKEQYLCKSERYAAERGISLFILDFFGPAGSSALSGEIAADPEAAIGAAMDYLTSRKDVDRDRIAILADGWGSSSVARAIGRDGRFAAAVCDAGIWDLQERAFLSQRMNDGSREVLRSSVARALNCPVLVTVGEDGWLSPDRVTSLVDQLRLDHAAITLKIFAREETASLQGHLDNPTLANEFIFDWIADRLGST